MTEGLNECVGDAIIRIDSVVVHACLCSALFGLESFIRNVRQILLLDNRITPEKYQP